MDGSTNLTWMSETIDHLTMNGSNPGAQQAVDQIVQLYGGKSLRFVADMTPEQLWDAFRNSGKNMRELLESRGYIDPLKENKSTTG